MRGAQLPLRLLFSSDGGLAVSVACREERFAPAPEGWDRVGGWYLPLVLRTCPAFGCWVCSRVGFPGWSRSHQPQVVL